MTASPDVEETLPPSKIADLVADFTRCGATVSDFGGRSVQGARRVRNEDAWGHQHSEVFVVADGIGGRRHGDVASSATVTSLLASLSVDVIDWREPMRAASQAVMSAAVPAERRRVSTRSDERSGPGGAVAAALRCRNGRTSLVHVGDARAYRIRDGLVEPLTRDHSVGEVMADLGVRRADTGLDDHELSSLTSFFGEARSWEEFTVRELTVRSGDRIVLCTDGCYRHLDRAAWMSTTGIGSAGSAADHLIDHAVAAGASDDATAMVIDFNDASRDPHTRSSTLRVHI